MNERVCDIMVCDAMVRKLVPTARAEMVCRLVHQQGVPQTEVARRLGISRAAISQYVSRKRGCVDGSGSHRTLRPDRPLGASRSWARRRVDHLCDICRCGKS